MSARGTTLALTLLWILLGVPAWSQTGSAEEDKAAYARAQMDKGERLREQGDTLNAAIAFHESGQAWFQLRQYARSRRSYEECLPLAEKLEHDLLQAVTLAHLGSVSLRFEDHDDAEEQLTRARDLALKLKNPYIELLTQSNLGDLFKRRGMNTEARTALERALLIAEALDDRGNQLAVCLQLSEVGRISGDHPMTREWLDRARTISRTIDDPQLEADVLLAQGRFHETRRALRRAQDALEQALDVVVMDHARASTLGHLGNVLRHAGDFSGALDCYQEALEIARDQGDLGQEIAAQVSIGMVHKDLADYETAQERVELALDMMGEDGSKLLRSTTLYELAMIRSAVDDTASAERLLAEALTLAEDINNELAVAQALSGMVVMLHDQERYVEALDVARRHGVTSSIPEARVVAQASEAYLLLEMDHLDEARRASIAAVTAARSLRQPTHLLNALGTRARIAVRDRDAELTRALMAEGDRLLDDLTQWDLGIERAALQRSRDAYSGWNTVAQDLTALLVQAAGDDGLARDAAIDDGFHRAGLAQGRALLHGIAEHRRGLRTGGALTLREELAEARADREALQASVALSLRSNADDAGIEATRTRAAALGSRIADLTAELARVAPREAALDAPRGVRHEEISQDVLRPGQALIQYVNGESDVYAYVVTPEGTTWHEVGPADAIHEASHAFLDGMRDPATLAGPATVAATGRPLYERLLVDLLPADTRELLIVPTSALSELPFEALVVEAEEQPNGFEDITFVIDRYEVAYGASTSVLSLLSRTGPRAEPGRMLILGDPRYGRELAAAEGGSEPRPRSPTLPRDFVRLPGTRDEAVGIARVIEQDAEVTEGRDVSLTTERFTLRLGTEATPSQLSDAGREYSVIHCAAHGYVDPEDARLSGIALTPGEQDDGYLSVAEILELDLDADLAVLSACETGRGEVLQGEGVQSVARAFAYAGARAVIASLWQVDDRETAETMTAFYSRYLPGELSASAALRQARLATRHGAAAPGAYQGIGRGQRVDRDRGPGPQGRPGLAGHPYFWAPFIYMGLPR